MPTQLSPQQRSQRARIAAYESWKNTSDRTARMAAPTAANPGQVEYWLDQLDPDDYATPEDHRKAAESARNAHMQRLAFKRSRKGGGNS